MDWLAFCAWSGFLLFVLCMLAIDLGVFHRRAHVVSAKEAIAWSAVWIILALGFCLILLFLRGTTTALEFLTGYLIEKSLSVDNLFVFVLIFTALSVSARVQHRILFWGILGALVMRGMLILLGSALLERFQWLTIIFGGFLVLTALNLVLNRESEFHPERSRAIKLMRRHLPFTETEFDDRLVVRRAGKWLATPLLLALITVETTDLVFALDSIPAIFGVTSDPFIIYTSNVFAILGLRALYFLLAGAISRFHYLRPGLSGILAFVGVKMLLADWFAVPTSISLLVIATILIIAMLASFARERQLKYKLGVKGK